MKLVVRLVLAMTVGMLILAVVNGYARARREEALFDATIRRDEHLLARAFGLAIGELWEHAPEQVPRLVEEANQRTGEGLEVRWVWLEPTNDPSTSPRVPLEQLGALGIDGERTIAYGQPGEEPRLYTYLTIDTRTNRRGALEIAGSYAQERAYVRGSIVRYAVFLCSLIAMGLLIALWLSVVWVARPVAALIEQARRVGAGDFSGRLEFERRDEIGDLAREVNLMTDRLAEAVASVRRESQARLNAVGLLRHADRLATVGTLASGIAHELGTPLNVVSGRGEMIASGEAVDEEARESAAIIVEQATKMTRIVRQLLDFARRDDAPKASDDLRELVQDVVAMLSTTARKAGVRLTVQTGVGAWPIYAHRGHLQQAITNLVMNAIQAMPNGGTVRLVLSRADSCCASDERRTGRFLRLEVSDEGVGIAPRDLERVFEPFFTTKQPGQGTGLGLSVCYGIVRDHGGFVDVESEPGKGTRFLVDLPEADATPNAGDRP